VKDAAPRTTTPRTTTPRTTTPRTTAPACTRLAEGLRELRVRTGLSLAALAERTAYSKSSWERYLNGRQLAPRQAVEALCAMAAEPTGRLVALWELADLEWSGRARGAAPTVAGEAAAPPGADESGDHPPPGDPAAPGPGKGATTRRRKWVVIAAACAVGVAAAVAALAGTGAEHPAGHASPTAAPAVGCRAQGCAGKDPGLMGCGRPGDVRALGAPLRTSTGARLEIRYNPRCDAAWARVWHTKVGDALEVSLPDGAPQRAEVADRFDAQGYRFTPMVDGSHLTRLRVCFEPVGGGRQCFRR
jgi:transcriptional regulator with XRE-family HTH domain